jgi:hypothetical protein
MSRRKEDPNWKRSKKIKNVWKDCRDRLMASKECPLKKMEYKA